MDPVIISQTSIVNYDELLECIQLSTQHFHHVHHMHVVPPISNITTSRALPIKFLQRKKYILRMITELNLNGWNVSEAKRAVTTKCEALARLHEIEYCRGRGIDFFT